MSEGASGHELFAPLLQEVVVNSSGSVSGDSSKRVSKMGQPSTGSSSLFRTESTTGTKSLPGCSTIHQAKTGSHHGKEKVHPALSSGMNRGVVTGMVPIPVPLEGLCTFKAIQR